MRVDCPQAGTRTRSLRSLLRDDMNDEDVLMVKMIYCFRRRAGMTDAELDPASTAYLVSEERTVFEAPAA